MEFYDVRIPLEAQPTFVLGIEQEELRITAGLQDRVIQVYEGMVYMDFARERRHLVDGIPCYHYEPLDPSLLPPIYLAYHDALSEPTEVFHNNIRERFDRGDEAVVSAMQHFASLAARGREALLTGDVGTLGRLINENFDTRRRIYNLPAWQIDMVETARRAGATAKFAGSGGAVIGTYPDEATFARVKTDLLAQGSKTVKPLTQRESASVDVTNADRTETNGQTIA
jgi:glucuronokinase